MSSGSELLAEVAGLGFGGTKEFPVGRINQGVGQLFEERGGLSLELGQESLPAFRAAFAR